MHYISLDNFKEIRGVHTKIILVYTLKGLTGYTLSSFTGYTLSGSTGYKVLGLFQSYHKFEI
jgi:hypothetical protein